MAKKEEKKGKRLRIFINSNAPWSISGYGQAMAELLPLIVAEGYPTGMCDFFGLQGGLLNLNNVIHYPTINHVMGSDALVHHARDFGADVTFTLQDIWPLTPQDLQQTNRFIPIVPIDHEPAPPAVVERLRMAYRIVSSSKFGEQELKRQGIHSTYIPYTVNTDIFKPMDKKERSDIRNKNGITDTTMLWGMVSANKDNPPRKSYQEVMDAFKAFSLKHPDTKLYIHTDPNFPGGFPIQQYAAFIGILDKVIFPETYQMNFKTPKEKMSVIINTFDCLLAPSTNEGFGVPIIEAQSCSVPVITNNFTSMRELVEEGVTGYKIEPLQLRYDALGSYVAVTDINKLYLAMEKMYKADRAKMGAVGRNWMIRDYDTKTVFETKWKPFLEKLEKEVYPE